MRCEELRDLILLRAIDRLEPAEESAVREHLDAGCPRCTAEMSASGAVVHSIPFALEPEIPSPMAKARLMAAVRADSAASGEPPANPSRRFSTRSVAAVAAASLLTAVVTGYAMMLRQREIVSRYESVTASLNARLERQGEELVSLTRQIRAATESIRFVSSPGVLTVDLSGQGDRADSAARVFWDRRRDSWQLYAENLPAPAQGRIYQLWLVTDTGVKISAGTFDPHGEAAIGGNVAVPPGTGKVIAAAVTDEPSGGSPQPTTQPFLLGRI